MRINNQTSLTPAPRFQGYSDKWDKREQDTGTLEKEMQQFQQEVLPEAVNILGDSVNPDFLANNISNMMWKMATTYTQEELEKIVGLDIAGGEFLISFLKNKIIPHVINSSMAELFRQGRDVYMNPEAVAEVFKEKLLAQFKKLD